MELVVAQKSDLQELVDSSIERALSRVLPASRLGSESPGFGWVSNEKAQELTGLSRPTLQRYRASGILQYSKLGSNVFYRLADLERLLESHSITPIRKAGKALAATR